MGKYTKEDCLALLHEKAQVLKDSGEARYLKRSDFSEEEVNAIKAFLGPWPRALEAAGLKEGRQNDRPTKNREKRIRAKRRRREAEKVLSDRQDQPCDGELIPTKEN